MSLYLEKGSRSCEAEVNLLFSSAPKVESSNRVAAVASLTNIAWMQERPSFSIRIYFLRACRRGSASHRVPPDLVPPNTRSRRALVLLSPLAPLAVDPELCVARSHEHVVEPGRIPRSGPLEMATRQRPPRRRPR